MSAAPLWAELLYKLSRVVLQPLQLLHCFTSGSELPFVKLLLVGFQVTLAQLPLAKHREVHHVSPRLDQPIRPRFHHGDLRLDSYLTFQDRIPSSVLVLQNPLRPLHHLHSPKSCAGAPQPAS